MTNTNSGYHLVDAIVSVVRTFFVGNGGAVVGDARSPPPPRALRSAPLARTVQSLGTGTSRHATDHTETVNARATDHAKRHQCGYKEMPGGGPLWLAFDRGLVVYQERPREGSRE